MQRQIDGREAVTGLTIGAEPFEEIGMGLQHAGKQVARHPFHQPERRKIDRFDEKRRKRWHAGLSRNERLDPRQRRAPRVCASTKTVTFFPGKGAS
ncbi:hypothetical protein GCM10023069_37440 [Shinella granuli]